MKNELATAIVAAIAGVVISYFVCNMFVGTSSDFSFNSVDASVNSELASPNQELFNYRALNPTVEVYVGNCTEVNMYGECVDASSEQIEEGIIEEAEEAAEGTNSTNNTNSTTNNGTNTSTNANNAQSNTSNANQRSDKNGVTD